MILVAWKGGEEAGFPSRDAAQRYIDRICKVVAPELNYSILEAI